MYHQYLQIQRNTVTQDNLCPGLKIRMIGTFITQYIGYSPDQMSLSEFRKGSYMQQLLENFTDTEKHNLCWMLSLMHMIYVGRS